MLKAADALAEAGCDVRVVSTHHLGWAAETDRELARTRGWRWTVVDYDRHTAPATWLWSGVRTRLARTAAHILGEGARVPVGLAAAANIRAHGELTRAAAAEPADLIYGGSSGGLLPAALAARRLGIPFVLDLEDFHSAEQNAPADRWRDRMSERVETTVLPAAAALTTSSRAMAAAYAVKYGVRATVIHNTFELAAEPPDPSAVSRRGLKLYWFGQTIGGGRGLEDAVRAMGLAGVPGELHLRGRLDTRYFETLRHLARGVAPSLRLVHHLPASPEAMVELCRPYDIGLSGDEPTSVSRELAVCNKALTYPLAGLAVVLSSTSGTAELRSDLGDGALAYVPGDVEALAAGFARWALDRTSLVASRAAAFAAAQRRWHWRHPAERDALVATVCGALL
ncbi:MAG: glycosyltransferase [Acidobacteriota bacterium]|nr:glycosyltransferase [Acidobacteriota bacterium]